MGPRAYNALNHTEASMHHRFGFLTAILWSGMLSVSAVSAQSVDTGILGSVADASGAVIPGADITVTRVSSGVAQNVVSGPNGTFEIRYLLPGDYVVEAKLSGFRTERRAVALRVAQMARLNVVLEVGQIGEVVDVVAKGLLLETQSGVTGTTVSAETIANLPLSGRNFTALGNLTAGVVASGTQFRASGARGMYQQVNFDGVSALNNRGNNLFIYPSVTALARPEFAAFVQYYLDNVNTYVDETGYIEATADILAKSKADLAAALK